MSILIKQHDITDCGAACLSSVSAHYKLNLSIAKIRQYANTDKSGTTMLDLVGAAVKLGFEAKGVRGTLASLTKIPLPAIAHIVKEELHHYVTIYTISNKHIKVMDPSDGKMHSYPITAFAKEWTGILLLLLPSKNFKINNTHLSHSHRFWQLINPHKRIVLQALFGAFVCTILGLSTAIFVQKITDYVLINENSNLLNLMSVVMLIILLLQWLIGTVKNIFILRTGQQIDVHLILGYYRHLLKLPQQFFDTMRIGEITSRVNDAVKIRTFINDISIGFVVNVFVLFFSFALMFSYYWKLALLMLTVIPLYLLIYIISNTINKKIQRKLMENSAELESQMVESLNALSTIKRFGLEGFINIKTETKFIQLLQNVYTSSKTTIISGASVDLISQALTILLLWIGAGYVLQNEITTGELFSFYTLIGYFTAPVASLISANKTIQEALIAADRLFEIMDLEIENDTAKFTLTPELIGDIRFENVSFSYNSRSNVFENLNLNIKAKNFTAIIGASGSGKSTIMALLQNIYPIQKGNIFIGKYSIHYLTNTSLRKLISIVPQKIDLFAGSVIENIAVGEDEPNVKHVIDICTQLGFIDFIESLPNGFETYVGENGAMLSGGQKQRIAIARALYIKPEVLILDEATSSLDSDSEQFVKKTIDILIKQQKTIIIIAHRLTTIQNANHIIVLDKGKVMEEGNHDTLMLAKGQYNQLWKQQFIEIQ